VAANLQSFSRTEQQSLHPWIAQEVPTAELIDAYREIFKGKFVMIEKLLAEGRTVQKFRMQDIAKEKPGLGEKHE
jgi:hypothetical protein